MAGKKKASKGGKKTSKSSSGKASKSGSGKVKEGKWEAAPVSDEPMPLVGIIDHIVSVQVRGITWGVLDFTLKLASSKRVHALIHAIEERHGGGITDLVLYKEAIDPRNVLSDPMRTLASLETSEGGQGPPGEQNLVVFYDFKQLSDSCPLLLSTPRNFKIEKKMQAEAAASHRPAARASAAAHARDAELGSTLGASPMRPSGIGEGRVGLGLGMKGGAKGAPKGWLGKALSPAKQRAPREV